MNPPDDNYSAFHGLWRDHPVLVQLLGLSPLLAVTTTLVNALGLGLVTLTVLLGSSVTCSLLRRQLNGALHLPMLLLIIAAWVTCAELLVRAYAYPLAQALGIFLPLIASNCVVLSRAQTIAARHPIGTAALDATVIGSGFLALLLIVGAIRELFGRGSLFADMHLIFGDVARDWLWQPFDGDYKLLILSMPAGAFLLLGFLIASKNFLDSWLLPSSEAPPEKPITGSKRVRTPGKIN